MEKNLINKIKEQLEKDKKNIEQQLANFASKDKNLKGDWDTRFPSFKGKGSIDPSLEESADEVEEYGNLLPVEHSLELKLEKINLALKKIKENKFGICEKCQEEISPARIKVAPEAKLCQKCKK